MQLVGMALANAGFMCLTRQLITRSVPQCDVCQPSWSIGSRFLSSGKIPLLVPIDDDSEIANNRYRCTDNGRTTVLQVPHQR